jgi:hypothetical protein
LIEDFSSHLRNIYELEMFYGDDTLAGLLEHATKLSGALSELDLVLNEEKDNNAEEEAEED